MYYPHFAACVAADIELMQARIGTGRIAGSPLPDGLLL